MIAFVTIIHAQYIVKKMSEQARMRARKKTMRVRKEARQRENNYKNGENAYSSGYKLNCNSGTSIRGYN